MGTLPRIQLPVNDPREALHLHHAHETRRGLEPDPVQPLGLHPPCLRYQLHRDPPCADPCELPHPPYLLLRPPLLRGGAPPRVQALPPRPEARRTARPCLSFGDPIFISTLPSNHAFLTPFTDPHLCCQTTVTALRLA